MFVKQIYNYVKGICPSVLTEKKVTPCNLIYTYLYDKDVDEFKLKKDEKRKGGY